MQPIVKKIISEFYELFDEGRYFILSDIPHQNPLQQENGQNLTCIFSD